MTDANQPTLITTNDIKRIFGIYLKWAILPGVAVILTLVLADAVWRIM